MPHDVELAQLGQGRCERRSDAPRGISEESGRSGTSEGGKIAVRRPGRLDSNINGGWSSLYMLFCGGPLFRTGKDRNKPEDCASNHGPCPDSLPP